MPSLLQALSPPIEPYPQVHVMPLVQAGLGTGCFSLGKSLLGQLRHTAETFSQRADIADQVVMDELTGLPLSLEIRGFDPMGYQEYSRLQPSPQGFLTWTPQLQYSNEINQLLSHKPGLLADTEVYSSDIPWFRPTVFATHLGITSTRRASEGLGTIPYAPFIRFLLESEQIGAARGLLNLALRELPDEPELRVLSEVLAPPRVKARDTRDVDRQPEYEWLRINREAYRGRWVALRGDTLLSSADSLKNLLEQLKAVKPERPPLIHRVD